MKLTQETLWAGEHWIDSAHAWEEQEIVVGNPGNLMKYPSNEVNFGTSLNEISDKMAKYEEFRVKSICLCIDQKRYTQIIQDDLA